MEEDTWKRYPIDSTFDPAVDTGLNWIWDGFLAPGDITLLTSQWKSGKTTLLTGLLRSMATGSPFLGRPTRRVKVWLLSEESHSQWGERVRQEPIGEHVELISRPFFGRPSMDEWEVFLGLVMIDRIDLFVVDTLASFLPGSNESDAGRMLEALQPLRCLTKKGISVLLLHHPRKRGGEIGCTARGSGALLGFVDTSLELRKPNSAGVDSSVRILYGQSRRSATPARLSYEWNPHDGFAVLPDPDRRQFEENWRTVRAILATGAEGMTHKEIVERWPADTDKPSKVTLYAWLTAGLDRGLIVREGRGTTNDPRRFKLCDASASVFKAL